MKEPHLPEDDLKSRLLTLGARTGTAPAWASMWAATSACNAAASICRAPSRTSSSNSRSRPTLARGRRWPRSTRPRTKPTQKQRRGRSPPNTGPSDPKAAAKISDDLGVLLAFYDYPAEHWVHLRTTNPIESTFATVRLRQRVTKGPSSRAAGIAMAFKLIESAQARWRMVNAPPPGALVRAGVPFTNGKQVERPDQSNTQTNAA